MKILLSALTFAAGIALAAPSYGHGHGGGGGGGGGDGGGGGGMANGGNMAGASHGGGHGGGGRSAAMVGPHSSAGHLDAGGARIVARQNANAHPGWSHNHDHMWHGHHCRFVNGSWVIFDLGFYDPFYWGWWGYPYYGYGSGYDYSGNYGANASPVASTQARLAELGYYHGEIDGVFGPATRRALFHYQRDHGLPQTGYVSDSTLQTLATRR